MKCNDQKKMSTRLKLVSLFFALFMGVIIARAVHLQVLQHSFLSEAAQRQFVRQYETAPRRGVIYDAMHRELAVTLDVVSIAARPSRIAGKDEAALAIAAALGEEPARMIERLDNERPFVWLARNISPSLAERVRDLGIKGLEFTPSARRFYPNRTLAGQVMGFCGVDGHGLEGLEFRFDDELFGEFSRWTVLRDALGKSFAADRPAPLPKAGNDLVLTLDRTVQTITEDALAEAVEKNQGKSGLALVLVPQTGAILAMAQYPFMNPNDFSAAGSDQRRNRAVTDTYEPGSTTKIFMAAAALESGLVSAKDSFYCENGQFRVGRKTVKDVHPYDTLTLEGIITHSSNIGAIKVGQRIGRKTLYNTLKDFGFGARTGVDCPGEARGLLSAPETWSEIDAAAIAFGQGFAVTPLQLVAAVGALANDGLLMRPRLVQAVTDSRGRLVKSFAPEPVRQVVSASTAQKVLDMMALVNTDGTGSLARLEGYSSGGKTGTAQKVSNTGGYAKGKYVASFVGVAPMERPSIAVIVVVDEPRRSIYGGTVAGPAFKKISEKTLQYLEIMPKSSADGPITACSFSGDPI
ncbi:MAG: penicillin-binding protein 2 [Desulfatibacillaceae bacterium]|nr:penicillin-binding protein 2 [Desulfatibacillaceae bacterium]